MTTHYIDLDFVSKEIITFTNGKYPHIGVAIEEALTKYITDYDIKKYSP